MAELTFPGLLSRVGGFVYHMKARAISQWPGTCTFLKNGPKNRPVHVGDMCFLFQWVGPFS